MIELQNYIANYFALKQEQLERLAAEFQLKQLDKDSFLATTGNLCDQLSFIKKGHLRIFEYVDGREITQWISSTGDFITDLGSLVFGRPARRNIQALTDCELYTIGKDRYRNLHQLIPQWPEIEKLFITKCFITLEDRVFGFLSMSAEQRYEDFFKYKKELFNQVPLHYLASMMGMSPETLSRIRKKATS